MISSTLYWRRLVSDLFYAVEAFGVVCLNRAALDLLVIAAPRFEKTEDFCG
jgi:hypothetical protein